MRLLMSHVLCDDTHSSSKAGIPLNIPTGSETNLFLNRNLEVEKRLAATKR